MIQAVVRIRGDINVKPDIKRTLHLLHLYRVNHCVLVRNSPVNDGMLNKVKDYVTWGEIKPELLARLIVTRGRLTGNRPIKPDYIKQETKHESLVTFAGAIVDGKDELSSLKDVKPLFRLHPPLQGHEGVKRSYKAGGALGYRGESINDLISRMLGPEPKAKKPKKAGKAPSAPKKKPAKKAPAKKAPGKKKSASKKETAKKTTTKREVKK
jgi:large subunit ribosomal protein L30